MTLEQLRAVWSAMKKAGVWSAEIDRTLEILHGKPGLARLFEEMQAKGL